MQTTESKVAEFKERVQKEWTGAEPAAAWEKHYADMKQQLAKVTRAIVDAAQPQQGDTILDLASGTGEPALPLARRVSPGGKVIATDLSEEMLDVLRKNAKNEGVDNIETRYADAHSLEFPDKSFDKVTSRFGVMFFVETDRALAEIRRVLKPGGRVALMVWGAPQPGSYFGAAVMPYMKRLEVKPDPDGPGPMRFAEPGKLVNLMKDAGYKDIKEESHVIPAPYNGSPEKVLTSMFEIAGPFRNAAATLSDEARAEAKDEAIGNLNSLYDGTHTNVTAPVMIVTATT